jgi:hypothetical protein
MRYMRRVLLVAILVGVASGAAPAWAADPPPDWSGLWLGTMQGGFGVELNAYYKPGSKIELPPYKPEYLKKYKHNLDQLHAGQTILGRTCKPPGTPGNMIAPLPIEFIIQPKRVTILTEWDNETRRIWTDGRAFPAYIRSSLVGTSRGQWEGGTLVVKTVGLRGPELQLDASAPPFSEQLTVTERIRLVAPDRLENIVTLNDPVALVRPWTKTLAYHKAEGVEDIYEYSCWEDVDEFKKANLK